jgi:predicted homoserine dehydrogenase-like protein
MIYQHLFDRVKEPDVVRAALIGCGDFGAPIVTQARLIPRLEVRVVSDTNVEAAKSAFRLAGAAEHDIAVCDTPRGALRAMEAGKWVIAADAMTLMDLPLHVVVTATRVPEAGAKYAYEAIRHGKHVVMVDKEADSVVGPSSSVLPTGPGWFSRPTMVTNPVWSWGSYRGPGRSG